jgi:hypothetical protein
MEMSKKHARIEDTLLQDSSWEEITLTWATLNLLSQVRPLKNSQFESKQMCLSNLEPYH